MSFKNHYSKKSNANFIFIVLLFLTFTLLEKGESSKEGSSEDIAEQTFVKYCENFTKASYNEIKLDGMFRIIRTIQHVTTIQFSWEKPESISNETVCGYILRYSTGKNNEMVKYVYNMANETEHTIMLNNSVDHWIELDVFYRGGLKGLKSNNLHLKKGWGKTKVDNTVTHHNDMNFFAKDSIHPITGIAVFIIIVTLMILVVVLVMAFIKFLNMRTGIPYIFNRPVLNTRESLNRARTKVRKMRNIFKDGSRGDTVNFSTLVDQTEFEC